MSATPLVTLTAVAAPLIRPNVDTDAIIPSREIKGVGKRGLAEGLFAGWRYTEVGGREPDPDFVLNDPRYRGARILLGGENFGCGSSREHAVWALAEYGMRAVVAPSFNPIFRNNCIRNGVAPVVAGLGRIEALAEAARPDPQTRLITVDLQAQRLVGPDGEATSFEMAAEARAMLMLGLDPIELTLQRRAEIDAFRQADAGRRPWAYL